MPIKIEDGSGRWVEFRSEKWTFGDRMAILDASSDLAALEKILPFVVGWNVTDVEGAAVPHDKGATALLRLDDDVATWLIRSWFEARAQRNALPKVS